LTPERIALALGCSRAARTILTSLDGIGFLVAEIAALSDFHDMFFTHTFKRRCGMTPRAAREASKSG
jgi:AraC-like DNA-binding protein